MRRLKQIAKVVKQFCSKLYYTNQEDNKKAIKIEHGEERLNWPVSGRIFL